ncbi:HIT-like protein [Mycena indigotica]|uniref:HIT-like protein n=1 Tax=Mycena indigotica TaxID=2126181 RepID=A0A8H6SIF5_9AGAR|nr:HIT-like protein [Mycena indigotica]KAF7299246.1 HIT-like protein [Mycena indigotica]
MTSFLINAHVNRPTSPWDTPSSQSTETAHDPNCTFCQIIDRSLPATIVYETPLVIAILDILPLRRGHTLVIPKTHYSRVSELPSEYSRAVGEAVGVVAKALTQALDNTGLNVVCNQEYAQAVPHVHYHVIPAPTFSSKEAAHTKTDTEPPSQRAMHRLEFESRSELDDDDALILAQRIRSRL